MLDRAGGGNYQTLINNALREYIQGARLETVVRQAVRDEVKAARAALAKTRENPAGVSAHATDAQLPTLLPQPAPTTNAILSKSRATGVPGSRARKRSTPNWTISRWAFSRHLRYLIAE